MTSSDPVLFETPTETEKPCAWCGSLTHGTIEIQKARHGIDKATGVKVTKKRAITSPCCLKCAQRLVPSEAPVGA